MIKKYRPLQHKSFFKRIKRSLISAFLLITLFNNAFAVEEDLAPESATGNQKQHSIQRSKSLVVTAHPLATQAGLNILKQGGSAADAAVAIQAMLTLVEPQSSGIGGGAFMLYWDEKGNKLHAYDGRETAPKKANHDLFVQKGQAMPWIDAMVGARSVGTPGVLKMLHMAQQKHGKVSWDELFNDSIQQATEGFHVSPRLHKLISRGMNPGLNRYAEARSYFFNPDGSPLEVGHLLKNPDLAASLQLVATQGPTAFYKGPLADKIIQRIQSVTDNPGLLSLNDLANYKAKERESICLPYKTYKVCGFPPPTSGGVTVLQILKLMEQVLPNEPVTNNLEFNHLFTQAARLAFADRGRYLADSDFVDVPVQGLLNPRYIEQRALLINHEIDLGRVAPGKPDKQLMPQGDDLSPELPSTSHFVVVDRWGNAVSITSSIEMAFGSTLMAGGFLLNNQLTDFSFKGVNKGYIVANRVQPGKRPRSSMSPFMVFDDKGRLYAAVGSPGGSRIINYVARSLFFMLNSELTLQEALNQPHISNRNGLTELEENTSAVNLQSTLEAMGHTVKVRDLNSGLHAFRRLPSGGWESGVDNRREGLALGQ